MAYLGRARMTTFLFHAATLSVLKARVSAQGSARALRAPGAFDAFEEATALLLAKPEPPCSKTNFSSRGAHTPSVV